MGSIANSLHVKCDDPNELVALINNVIRDAGYNTTAEQPDEEAMWGMPSPIRAIHVAECHNGWVAAGRAVFQINGGWPRPG